MDDLNLTADENNWLDKIYLHLKSRKTLFSGGWGDEKLIYDLIQCNKLEDLPRPINIHFTNQKKEKNVSIHEAYFENPFFEFPQPKNTKKVFLEIVVPKGKDLFKKRNDLPLVLIMPASGDEGFQYRKKKLAFPLAEKGIGSILIEIPFYGKRRPPTQELTHIQLVSDFLLMIYLSIQEGRSLLHSFYKNGFSHLGVTGLSMGGFAAGGIAASLPFPTATVCALAGNTIADTMAYGTCFENCIWESLTTNEGLAFAQKKLHRYFSLLANLEVLPPPPSLQSTLLINATNDTYIPAFNSNKLRRHWRGVEQILIPGGHFSTILQGTSHVVEGIEKAFSLLPTGRQKIRDPFSPLSSFAP